MKKLLWLCLALLFSGSMMAQELVVKSFEQNTRDLTAKTHPVKDLNGDYCALIRVQVAAKDCLFRGNIVGEPQAEWGEYKVYMAAGSRNLYISHPDFIFTPLNYEFPEKILSGHTYSLRLEVPVYTNYSELAAQQIASQEKTYKVGDYYNENGKEGVVFWVDETGKHGKIVGMKEWFNIDDPTVNPVDFLWTTLKESNKTKFVAKSRVDGKKNMEAIMSFPNWREEYPPLAWCANLGKDWYIPAIEELLLFYENKDLSKKIDAILVQHGGDSIREMGGKIPKGYYSSTEEFLSTHPGTDKGVLSVLYFDPYRSKITSTPADCYCTKAANVRPIATF